ncbi:MAG: hypothetical protein MI700_02420 [Balneolales bacterium]|nr:hypothetical protein [Balneolales bacterium]
MNKQFLVISGLILIAAISRMIPHPLNFAPIGAMSLFGAAYFTNKKFSFILPLLAMFISDLLVNNIIYGAYYQSFTLFTPGFGWVYGSIAAIVLVGIFLFRKVTFTRILAGSLSASILFFLITNFGVWLSDPDYPLNFAGLMLSYEMAIPFFKNTIAGDLFYCTVLFGGFEFAKAKIPQLQSI